MLQINIQGRGGQGAQKAAQILATAFFHEGKYVQAFATYGGARRGAPVSSYIRADNKKIYLRCDIEQPDGILFFDPSLLNHSLLKGISENTMILINSSKEAEEFKHFGNYNFVTVDAKAIARKTGLGRIVNSALLGAFAALLDQPEINNLLKVVEEMSPTKVQENINSCLNGYELIKEKVEGGYAQ